MHPAHPIVLCLTTTQASEAAVAAAQRKAAEFEGVSIEVGRAGGLLHASV
jgi:hypothetical protein